VIVKITRSHRHASHFENGILYFQISNFLIIETFADQVRKFASECPEDEKDMATRLAETLDQKNLAIQAIPDPLRGINDSIVSFEMPIAKGAVRTRLVLRARAFFESIDRNNVSALAMWADLTNALYKSAKRSTVPVKP